MFSFISVLLSVCKRFLIFLDIVFVVFVFFMLLVNFYVFHLISTFLLLVSFFCFLFLFLFFSSVVIYLPSVGFITILNQLTNFTTKQQQSQATVTSITEILSQKSLPQLLLLHLLNVIVPLAAKMFIFRYLSAVAIL